MGQQVLIPTKPYQERGKRQNALIAKLQPVFTGHPMVDAVAQVGSWLTRTLARAPETPQEIASSLHPDAVMAPLEMGAKAAAGAAKAPIKAYHGSPHDFDQFSLSKMGTGEGGQAYGPGLYFAEAEDTAKYYRDGLGGRDVLIDGMKPDVAPDLSPNMRRVLGYMNEKGMPVTGPSALLDVGDAYRAAGGDPRQWREFTQEWNSKVVGRIANGEPRGKMYEVAIKADPGAFIDFDAPVSQQSETVRQALRNLGVSDDISGRQAITQIQMKNKEMVSHPDLGPTPVESNISEVEATSRLRQAGVPGIKYFDESSRDVQILNPNETTSGQWIVKKIPNGNVLYRGNDEAAARAAFEARTRNYVVFDDKLIEILRKYGFAPPLAIGMSEAKKMGLKPEQMQMAPGSTPQMPQGDAFSRTMQKLRGGK